MKKRIPAIILILAMALSLFAAIPAFAAAEKDYTIGDAWWDLTSDNKALAKWDKAESPTSYKIKLMKGSKEVQKYTTAGGGVHDYTSTIINKGTGIYTFYIYPAKGGVEMEIQSDELEVDSETLSFLKKAQKAAKEQQAYEAASDGWHQGAFGIWTYGKGNHTLAKNEWLDINGQTYHFDSKGYMQQGWQQIGGVWYYFDPVNGNLYRNCVTPDGYTVNAAGVWVDEAGNPAQVSSSSSYAAAVNSVTVQIGESGADGSVRSASVSGVSGADLVNWSFSSDPSSWTAGSTVGLTVVVKPRAGQAFNSNTRFNVNNGKVVSHSGSDPVTIKINYTPRMKLQAPSNVYVSQDGLIKWTSVPHAKKYKVKVYNGSSLIRNETADETFIDIGDIVYDDEYSDVSIAVIAAAPNANYIDSDPTRLKGLTQTYSDGGGLAGDFERTGKGLSYKDETGKKVKGWNLIAGAWYYFDANGYAKTGWFQDTDGNWYYFGADSRMQTGNVNDGTAVWFCNDGSNPNYPYGAWVQ